MCFTNSLNIKLKKLAKTYALAEDAGQDFNSMPICNGFDFPEWPILTAQIPDFFQLASWGLIPRWVKNSASAIQIRASTLNARSETIYEKPSYKGAAITGHRCIVPTTGFFEWQTVGKKKYPYFISIKKQEVFSLAGLWEYSEVGPEDRPILTFTIVTVPANPLLEKIHNTKKRMPAILLNENISKWLDPHIPQQQIMEILSPISDKNMQAHPIRPLKESGFDFKRITEPYEYPELTQQLNIFPG